MQQLGIEHIFYQQVDNPTVIIADPVLIGFHAEHRFLITTNDVCKTNPLQALDADELKQKLTDGSLRLSDLTQRP